MTRLFLVVTVGFAIAGLFAAPANAACPNGTSDPQYCTPSAPEATTNPATSVAATSAVLNGAVVPNGQATTYFFEYGTSAGALTSSTSPANAGNDYTSHPVSSSITGLTPNTTYFFRVAATNASGTVRGQILQFTTPAGPPTGQAPTATTTDCSNITAATASLNGTVNPNGSATTYYFEYGTTTTYGTQTTSSSAGAGTTAVNVSADLVALTPLTTYHFRLVATNGTGTSRGEDKTCVTGAPVPGCPTPAVVTGTANSITITNATLTGTVDANGAQTYHAFEYGLTSAYGTRTATQNSGSGTEPQAVSAVITGLKAGTTYHYRVIAANTCGQVALGSDQTFTTPSPYVIKGKPQLTIKARPKRDKKKPWRYRIGGRLLLPAGVSKAEGCEGRVKVRIARANKTVAVRRPAVRGNCKYHTRIRVANKNLKKRRGQLRVRNKFPGNAVLKPVFSKRVNVYYGPKCTKRTGKCTGGNATTSSRAWQATRRSQRGPLKVDPVWVVGVFRLRTEQTRRPGGRQLLAASVLGEVEERW